MPAALATRAAFSRRRLTTATTSKSSDAWKAGMWTVEPKPVPITPTFKRRPSGDCGGVVIGCILPDWAATLVAGDHPMRSRLTIRTFAVAGALLCIAAFAVSVSVAAQAAPVRIVQGSNGTLYVLQGDKSWTLVPDQINDADAAALSPSGEIDGTLPEDLLVVQPPAAPPVAAPAPPAAPPPAPAPAAPSVASGPPKLTIGNPLENQNVSAKGGATFTISGTAADPVAGAGGIDVVDVWIFGERNAAGSTHLGTALLQSDGSWSLDFQPTRFTSTHTNIYVYAHSKASGLETELTRGFNIVG